MILQCLNACLEVSVSLSHTTTLNPSFCVFEEDKREAGYRYCCHMLLNEKALLSKQMGFLNIETAACLFNMTVLNLSLFHHFDKLPPIVSLLSHFLRLFLFFLSFFFANLKSLRGTLALCEVV